MLRFRNLIIKVYKALDWYKDHKLDLSIKGLIFHLKELFKRPEIEEENYAPIVLEVSDDDGSVLDKDQSRNSLLKVFDYSIFPDPVIEGNTSRTSGLLIVDDATMTKYLYDSDFRKIKRIKGKDILDEYKIYAVYGDKCGYTAYKAILNPINNINYALLDITLGSTIKHESGLYLEIDGIDIAIRLLTKNPDAKFIFISAHTLNIRNPIMKKYIEKFNDITGLDIRNYYINKSDNMQLNRYQAIYNLLYGEEYGKY